MRTCRQAMVILVVMWGCGPAPVVDAPPVPTFPAAALATAVSESGALVLELRTAPQPPARGTGDAQLVVRDLSGAPVDGLSVAVVPWMVTMGHGSSVVPLVTASGAGTYLVRSISLFMPGEWQLRVALSGGRTDRAVFTLPVP